MNAGCRKYDGDRLIEAASILSLLGTTARHIPFDKRERHQREVDTLVIGCSVNGAHDCWDGLGIHTWIGTWGIRRLTCI